jgi:hypothetical protein
MKTFIAMLLLLTCNLALAEMYKSLDENGEVVYSDKPPTLDAKQFKPPALTVRPPIKYTPKEKPVSEAKTTPYPYSELLFTKPEYDANFHDNEGNIAYALQVMPTLNTKLGHYLIIKLDGTVITKKTNSLSGTLKGVDRGSHNLSADILDASGAVLRSTSLSFHVHKTSLLKNQPVIPPPPPATP